MAVYTDVSFEELEVFLASYDLGHAHVFKGIAEGVSNSNYYLQTSTGAYILTLYEKRVERDDLPFYLGLMDHLARAGHQMPHTRPLEGRQADRHPERPAGGDPHLPRWRVAQTPDGRALQQDRTRTGGASRGGGRFHPHAPQLVWARRMEAARRRLRGQGGFGRRGSAIADR